MSDQRFRRRDFLKTGAAGVLLAGVGPQTAAAQSVAEGPTVYAGDNTVYALDATTGEQQWAVDTGEFFSSPTGVDGTVFIGSVSGNVYALDAQTGDIQWEFDTGGDVDSSPTVVDGTVFVGSDGIMYALDAETGDQQWIFEMNNFSDPPSTAVVDGRVIVGGPDTGGGPDTDDTSNDVHALDATTGDRQWSVGVDGYISSSPTMVDDTVFFGSDTSNVYALDAATGDRQWVFDTDDQVFSSPTVVDGTVFIGSNDSNVYALDAATGDQQWAVDTGDAVTSSPTVMDGTVFVGSVDSNVYALDAETGDQQWAFETGDSVLSSPTVVDGTVFIGSNDSNVYALDAATGDQQWEFDTGYGVASSPTVVADPANGDSVGSRVTLGTLGHTDSFAEQGPSLPDDDPEPQSFNVQTGLAVTDGTAYLVEDGEIKRVDLDSRSVSNRFDAPNGRPRGLAYGNGSLWFADGVGPEYDGEILELDPENGEVRSRISTSYDPRGLAFGEGSLWVIDITSNDIVEYSPDGTRSSGFDIRGPTGVTVGRGLAYFDGSLWVGEICGGSNPCTASLYEFTTDGAFVQETGQREIPSGERGGYGGLATTATELLGPDRDGNLTVLRTLVDEPNPVPTEFENRAGTKVELAEDIDQIAVALSEADSIEDVLDGHRQAFRDGAYGDDDLPNEAVARLIQGELITEELIFKTGSAGTVRVADRTVEFAIQLAVSSALLGLSFTDLFDADLNLPQPVKGVILDDIDTLVEESIKVILSEEVAPKAVPKVWDTVESLYEGITNDEFEDAEAFSQAASLGIASVVADLTLQQRIETGPERVFASYPGGIPEAIFDQLLNVERSLSSLNDAYSAETVLDEGLRGDFEGVQTARGDAIAQIDSVAGTTDTFLQELESRLGFVSIFENVYEFVTGLDEGVPLWRLLGLILTLASHGALAAATVRAIGVLVGNHSLRVLMTLHARGIYGVERGDPLSLQDVLDMLPDEDEILNELDDIEDRNPDPEVGF